MNTKEDSCPIPQCDGEKFNRSGVYNPVVEAARRGDLSLSNLRTISARAVDVIDSVLTSSEQG